MKTKLALILVPVLIISVSVLIFSSSAGELKWHSFDSAIALNKSNKKKIIIDVYTNWCGWCKKMDSSTYKDAEIINYLDKKYLAVKLNAESDSKLFYEGVNYTEQQFSGAIGITGYPATVFMDENCKIITIVPGYLQPKQFLSIAKYFGEDVYKTQSFDEYIKKQNIKFE
jgi:thioredoxin-related protein